MSPKSKSGKQAILFDQVKGVLIVGDASTPLADDSWFIINAVAGTSTLPFGVGYVFKSPDSGNAITPAIGDDVFPLTLNKICKADASISAEKGTIDTTDDCSNGYNSNISDGYTTLSGSVSAYLKFNDPIGDIVTTQEKYLNKFFDVITDDGAGSYTLTSKNDDDILLAILQNSDMVAVGDKQEWLLVPAVLTSQTLDKPLKGVQNFDFAWTKGEGAASKYQRTTNATESVF